MASRGAEDAAARLAADLRVRDAAVAAAQAELAGRDAQLAALQALLETVTVQRADEVAQLSAQLATAEAARNAALAAAAAAEERASVAEKARSLAGAREATQSTADCSGVAPERSLDAAHVRIATLQARVHDLRAALADAQARALDGDSHAVDRRVVGALLAEFLRLQRASGRWGGHGSQRSRDSLAVLARMLGLGAREREAIGCDDEVVGPAEVGGNVASGVAGLLGALWRGGGSSAAARGGTAAISVAAGLGGSDPGSGGDSPAGHASLGAAFVHFLLEETATMAAEAEEAARLQQGVSGGAVAQSTGTGVADPGIGGAASAHPSR